MSQRFAFGVAAAVVLVTLGPSCTKNEPQMRPASGTNPDYDHAARQREQSPSNAPAQSDQYPTPGSGTGVPGTETTPGATEPGDPELEPRDPTTLNPGGYPMGHGTITTDSSDTATWGTEPMTNGGTGGSGTKPKGAGGKGTAGSHSH